MNMKKALSSYFTSKITRHGNCLGRSPKKRVVEFFLSIKKAGIFIPGPTQCYNIHNGKEGRLSRNLREKHRDWEDFFLDISSGPIDTIIKRYKAQ
jgi:hypothetical protein